MSSRVVWIMPSLSSQMLDGPRFRWDRGKLLLEYDYELPQGGFGWTALKFEGVIAYQYTYDSFCSADQSEAYEELRIVEPSAWVEDLGEDVGQRWHFRIYFDEDGCYEVIAAGFISPPPYETIPIKPREIVEGLDGD